MNLPSISYPSNPYLDDLRLLAWFGAGWAASRTEEWVDVWGPASIDRTVDADIAQMTGCLDARL